MPVATTTASAPVQKLIPITASNTTPPAKMVTEILVSTYPTMEMPARYHRAAGE